MTKPIIDDTENLLTLITRVQKESASKIKQENNK